MIKNYLKTAWRNLGKNKLYSFINIAGLSAGMAIAIMIGLWIHDEVSYNKNFKNYDRIAQVIQNVSNNGEVQTWFDIPWPLADEIRTNYGSDFKKVVLSSYFGEHILSLDDKKLRQQGSFIEKEAPELFSLEMLKGDHNSLADQSSVILSQSAAKSFFEDDNPIGKTIKIDNDFDVKVTGIYKDFPENCAFADINFFSTWDLLYNGTNWIKTMTDPWRPNAFSLFVQLNDNADFKSVSVKIKDAKLKKVNEQLAKKKPELFLLPMSRWHLHSEYRNGVNTGGAIQYVWMFGIIGVFVLLLACINFMNLSTARSEKRAKEVGIRKTVGSMRKQLVFQFFCESLLTVIFSFVLSVIMVQLLLPFFNEVSEKHMSILWDNPVFWLISLVFILFTALIAGSYPALYLSSFRPVKVLKGTFKAGRFAALPRKALVVVQFTVSVVLIIGTSIVYKQIQFAKGRPVGYTKEGLVTIPSMTHEIHSHFDAIREELIQSGAIVSMAESGSPTTATWSSTSGLDWKGKDPNLSIDFSNVGASYDYGKTIGWNILKGRDFSRDFATDSSAVILNKAAADFIGFKEPIGETILWWGNKLTVVGVVDNMVMNSPYTDPRPTIFNLSTEEESVAIMRINPAINAKDAVSKIETIYKKFDPAQLFEYQFADEVYDRKFRLEERIGKLSGFFTLLAILISCLGLFGLASFVAAQRTKEIGVRKVLGASVFSVWNLLSKDFIFLVSISFLIAVPLSWYMMNKWLTDYVYHASIGWEIFIVAGVLIMLIALLTVSFQAIKAALSNPVKSLRTE